MSLVGMSEECLGKGEIMYEANADVRRCRYKFLISQAKCGSVLCGVAKQKFETQGG